jgi:hypothetical protein
MLSPFVAGLHFTREMCQDKSKCKIYLGFTLDNWPGYQSLGIEGHGVSAKCGGEGGQSIKEHKSN